MRKLFTVCCFAVLFGISTVYGNNSSLFSYDKNELEAQMIELTELENYVNENHCSYTEAMINERFESINLNTESSFSRMFTIDEMDWGSFAWGFCCCLSPIGFFTIALNDEKTQEQKTSYWIGVIVCAVLGAIGGGSSYTMF